MTVIALEAERLRSLAGPAARNVMSRKLASPVKCYALFAGGRPFGGRRAVEGISRAFFVGLVYPNANDLALTPQNRRHDRDPPTAFVFKILSSDLMMSVKF